MGLVIRHYVSIVAEVHPERVSDMLAYLRLIVREACKFGSNGWLTYDSVFRRNHEGKVALWNYIDASLHQVFIANQSPRVTVHCKHCCEIDQPSSNCAMVAVLPKSSESATGSQYTSTGREHPYKGKRPAPYPRQRPICSSWNNGICQFPGKCSYAHVCGNCYSPHPVSACKERPFTGTSVSAKQLPSTTRRE